MPTSSTQSAKEVDIANAFLAGIGAPQTANMQRAVVAWMRAESGRRIIGNNPWNISYSAAKNLPTKPTGFRTHSVTGQKFAVYANVEDGARASAELLKSGGNDWRGYGRVIAGAKSGNPLTFLNALAASAWDAGRYGTLAKNKNPTNKLIGIYNSVTGLGNSQLVNPSNGVSTTVNKWYENLKGIGISTDPKHVITEAEAKLIVEKIYKQPPGNVADAIAKTFVGTTVGSWATKLDTGEVTNSTDPLGALDPLANIAGVLATIVNPANWIRILALLAGAAMAAYGSINVLRAAG